MARQILLNTNQSGAKFYSLTHEAVLNRNELLVRKKEPITEVKEYQIRSDFRHLDQPVRLLFSKLPPPVQFTADSQVAFFDEKKLRFPLIVRKWLPGDKFQPLGMKGFKKVSDFFVDLKLSLLDKEKVHVLISNQQIIWVIGYRIDDRCKVTSKTKNILKITCETP
jgi:tRNA(Ile)-lysidine synthase